MITVSRICSAEFSEDIFSGQGAFLNGGRWNSEGNRVVYTAQSLSLATLEYLVHLDVRQLNDYFVSAEAIFPEEIVESLDLSEDRLNTMSVLEFKQIGDRWISENRSAVLRVSSIISQQEYNYLFNHNHPEFDRINFQPTKPFRFDPRLVKQEKINEQAIVGLRLCNILTSFPLPINLVTIDDRNQDLIILAGQEIEIVVAPNGIWRFES